MALIELVQATFSDNDPVGARAIAAILNADRVMRAATFGGDGYYTEHDVMRLGQIFAAYAGVKPPEPTEPRTETKPDTVRDKAVTAIRGELGLVRS